MFDFEDLLKYYHLNYQIYKHLRVLSYEDAEVAKRQANFDGTETKTLLLQDKRKHYYMVFTLARRRVSFPQLRELAGKQLTFVSEDKVEKVSGCIPGCLCPFGYPDEDTLIIDNAVFKTEGILFSKREPTQTIKIDGSELEKAVKHLPNQVIKANL
ncbi:hypothetical protein PL11_003610 [Lentilactobacillus curieae]|uniref:YbaK/aminoacyl-tRNA synthetase-associated domain-containing protein n=1 Tax=Lentilactobacillus curieae TaxID=1138822 RepID=A0A1S6QHJ0_9LACO|nr:YbaK/EbsC family protein [Lentilactobacillus curieae]AQW21072.1 hypothetical protein PL11_003610 [Lentilactobacillus curieae]